MEFITNNLKEIVLAIVAMLCVGVAIKIRNSYKVNQNDNNVGGDMAGRDIHKTK